MTKRWKLKILNSEIEIELSEALLLLHETRQCLAAMKLWFNKYAVEDGIQPSSDEQILSDALLRDTIIQFVGNFDRTTKHALDENEVFADVEGGVDYISWLRDIRDSYAAHKFGVLRQCVAGVIVDEMGALKGPGHLMMHGSPVSKNQEGQMLSCINIVRQHLEAKVTDLEGKLLAKAECYSPQELLGLQSAKTYAPNSDELRMSRKKMKKRHHDR